MILESIQQFNLILECCYDGDPNESNVETLPAPFADAGAADVESESVNCAWGELLTAKACEKVLRLSLEKDWPHD